MQLTVIGCGSLGTALVESALKSEILFRENLTVIERNESDRRELGERLQINVQAELGSKAKANEIILLVVKPKDLLALSSSLSEYIKEFNSPVISSLAGVSVRKLQERLGGHSNLIRVMPNLGAQVGLGVTGIFAPSCVSDEIKKQATQFFAACGLVVPVEKEPLLDLVTAISGSGSAYICAFLEALEASAISRGLDKEYVRASVLQTLYATAKILSVKDLSPEKLRVQVTSPGGVTEAALNVFKNRDLSAVIDSAIQASIDKSLELDKLA